MSSVPELDSEYGEFGSRFLVHHEGRSDLPQDQLEHYDRAFFVEGEVGDSPRKILEVHSLDNFQVSEKSRGATRYGTVWDRGISVLSQSNLGLEN